jgi:hypothetical protein
MTKRVLGLFACLMTCAACAGGTPAAATTIAQWGFDEPQWLYPSHVMDATAGLDAPLVLGLGGRLVPGRFGNALSTKPYIRPS